MTKLTGADAHLAAQCAAPGWTRWVHSTRDGLAHAFPAEDSQQDRWLRRATAPALVTPPPVHHYPRAA